MWYVIQTISGNEIEIKRFIESNMPQEDYTECFVPLYEEVRRRDGKSRILFRKMFPGYLFIGTGDPVAVFYLLKAYPEFTRVLGAKEADGTRLFIPIESEDESFLKSLLSDGIMHVSYVEMAKNNRRIEKIIGPLAQYSKHITHLEVRHREAIVDMEVFGKRRKIRFGLWKDTDAKLPWIERQKQSGETASFPEQTGIDFGIHPGDKVRDISGVYGEYEFIVERINPLQRTLRTKIEMLGGIRNIELFVDNVELVR